MEHTHIRVLLVDGRAEDHSRVKTFLQQSEIPVFFVGDFDDPLEAMNYLLKNKASVDIILLGLGISEHGDPEKIFQKIHGAAPDVPIIIFTGAADHDLAMLVMKEGAADNITREIFTVSPERLKNAIECSLSRNDILKKFADTNPSALRLLQRTGAVELMESEKMGAAELKESEETSAAELMESEKTSALELKHSEETAAIELKELHIRRLADIEYHQQVLAWMGGGYSVDGNLTVDIKEESAKEAHKKSAMELKNTQSTRAIELKENQRKGAVGLRESRKDKAFELSNNQKVTAATLLESQQKLAFALKKNR